VQGTGGNQYQTTIRKKIIVLHILYWYIVYHEIKASTASRKISAHGP
jgi:hypothetical protein